jgi:hypothetical protein
MFTFHVQHQTSVSNLKASFASRGSKRGGRGDRAMSRSPSDQMVEAVMSQSIEIVGPHARFAFDYEFWYIR